MGCAVRPGGSVIRVRITGCSVGIKEGTEVGSNDRDGISVGPSDEGLEDGSMLGIADGSTDGLVDGTNGTSDGASERIVVSDATFDALAFVGRSGRANTIIGGSDGAKDNEGSTLGGNEMGTEEGVLFGSIDGSPLGCSETDGMDVGLNEAFEGIAVEGPCWSTRNGISFTISAEDSAGRPSDTLAAGIAVTAGRDVVGGFDGIGIGGLKIELPDSFSSGSSSGEALGWSVGFSVGLNVGPNVSRVGCSVGG